MCRRLLLAAALLVASVDCGNLDSPDKVHDLRLLAMKAEPPDQVFTIPPCFVAQFLDAGALQGNDGVQGYDLTGDAGASSDGGGCGLLELLNLANELQSLQAVTVTGLIADPAGEGRPVHWSMEVCPTQDPNTNQCIPDDPNLLSLGSGDVMTVDSSAEISASFVPVPASGLFLPDGGPGLLLSAFQEDPYHGFDFLPLYAQLTISAGTETVTGFKRVNFTGWYDPTTPPPAPDQNPIIPELTIGGQVWAESQSLALGDGPYELLPVLDPAWEVSYLVPTFEGTYLTFQEDWIYDYFATAGGFDFSETGGETEIIGTQIPIQSDWSGPGDGVSRTITFWVCVRDGRGGTNWTVRTAEYPFPDGGE